MKYEIQYLDGFGCWRRWALCDTPEQTVASMARLHAHGITGGRVRPVSR